MPAFTPHAVRLASIYFPILVDCAKRKRVTTYGDLISAAKARHPGNDDLARAIPGSTRLKLDVIKAFCKKSSLPDLASLAIDDNTDEEGGQPAEKPAVTDTQSDAFAFDWERKLSAFDAYIIDETKQVVPTTKRKEDEAAKVLFQYYSAHKSDLPPGITKQKTMLMELLMAGYDAEDAFAMVAVSQS